jgi:hypothetical protein
MEPLLELLLEALLLPFLLLFPLLPPPEPLLLEPLDDFIALLVLTQILQAVRGNSLLLYFCITSIIDLLISENKILLLVIS